MYTRKGGMERMTFKWAYGWMGKYKWRLVLSIVLNILGVVAMTAEPFIFSAIVDDVLMPQQFDKLLPMLCSAIGVGCIFIACRYFQAILGEQAAQAAVYNVRSALFKNLMKQSGNFYATNRSGDLINKCSSDVEMMNHFICWVTPKWVEMVLMLVAALIVFFRINWQYTLILFAVTPFSAIVGAKLAKSVRPAFADAREQLSRLNTVVQENISGNRVVKAFVREDYEIEKFQKENQEYKRLNIQANMIWLKYGPIIDSIASVMTVMNLIVGGVMVVLEQITLGDLTLFLSLAWALNEPMILVGQLVNDTQRFLASAEKVMGLYYTKTDIEQPIKDSTPATAKGEIEFKDVSLSYGSLKVLDHVDLHINPGETIGIMGPTGSGKTSLVSLIPRFIDVSSGEVMLDGVNVKNYNLQKLRSRVGMTMQDVFLFSDTVESNIVYGVPDLPMEKVVEAAKVADADGFISQMPDGYDTIVGERGTGLSGGQKQRISLARAIAKDAPVLILDDTTSAVDMETETAIQKALGELETRATTLIIAQRVSSVMHADRIIILDDGKIVEQGSHNELMALKGYYYNTCILQHGVMEEEVSA